ncbi:hypothetical protein [Methylobacterium sp. ARG-1]|uniref:hypothetical protein n=1 Tax=Methylobacterium sp. ARG-1 TaxID=1692501 RepID=UPI001364994B|nr:hypothetical protein [Methylobacterium sp. ARG-1]
MPKLEESQIAAKMAVAGRKASALATSKRMAVIRVTKPITTEATAMLFSAVARSFVCSS